MKRQRLSLVERLARAYREWNDALADLNDADFERMVYRRWSLKDIVGHGYVYLDLALQHVKSYQTRKRLASPHARSYSFFNQREAQRLKNVPLAKLRADLDAAYHELMRLAPTLSDDDLNKRFPAQWSNSTYTTTLRYQLRETATHLQIHANQVKEWRKREHIGK